MTKLLLVEDHEEIWGFLSRRLERRGFDVTVATDGQADVDQARALRPDDMNLPVLDRWSAARALKADPATAAIPIMALTAHAMSGDQERTLDAGCDNYHPNPIDFSRLLDQIDAILGSPAASGRV